ncbi:MAG: hypothetical protein KGZ63_09400 [Clostridiales bacterium]|nr:hypothetical protein [Clostridiales bacterium]
MKKSKVIIISGVVILLALMFAPIMVSTVWSQGSTSDWISFYGSYFGALFGAILVGLVAFVVARIQVEDHKDQERNRRIIQQLPTLIQLKFEVEKAKKYIDGRKNLVDNKEQLKQQVINFPMNTFRRPQDENKSLWYQIDKIEDAELMADIIRFRENYFKLCDTLALDIQQLQNVIDSKNIEIKRVEKKNDPQSQNKKKQMTIEERDLHLDLEIAKDNKLKEWQKIEDGSYLGEVTKIEEELNSTIEGIEKIKAEKN